MAELSKLNLIPCRDRESVLSQGEIDTYKSQLPQWEVIEVANMKRLQSVYKFKNFAQALAFTNRIGELAEAEDHHPTLLTEWGKVTVTWWTHKIKGLHQNDFIMAAKSDELYLSEYFT